MFDSLLFHAGEPASRADCGERAAANRVQKTPQGWNAGSLDLSNWRGQTMLLQLVMDSVGDNLYDWGWWADLSINSSSAACTITLPSGAQIGSAGGTGGL